MKWKSSLVAAMWLSAAMVVGASGAESSAEPQILDESFLESLRSEIRTRHPSVATVEARVRAAEEQVRALRLWEDPTLGAGVIGADRAMRQDQGDWMVSFAQPLPRLKWVAARRERARALRDGAAAEARWMRLDLERRAAEAAIALALADESIRITTDQLGWFEGMTATAKERLKDPAADVSEALRLESELARERQRWETLRRQRAALAWQLNLLLGRETSAAWTALQLPATTALPPPSTPDWSQLVAVNPRMEATRKSVEAARAEWAIARSERRPIFSLGVASSVYSVGDVRQTTVGATMTLPWFNGGAYRAAAAQAQAELEASEHAVDAVERELQAEIVRAQTEAETMWEQARTLSRDVVPRALQAVASTHAAWLSSRARVLDVLDARRAWRQAQWEERQSVAGYGTAMATLRSLLPSSEKP